VVRAVDGVMEDIFEVWHPFATRFAAMARGELPRSAGTPLAGRELPLLGG
jgi:hypothetical protein